MNGPLAAFDWNQVRAFLATAEAGSLSAAARELGLAQPTLGRQVAALERDLGVILFERIGRGLTLTPTGRDLLAHVQAMGAAAARISLSASSQSQSVEGLVRISASDMFAAYVLPAMLKRLHQQAPGITVEVIASNTISDLMRREADIAIRHVSPEQPDLIGRRRAGTSAQLYGSTSYLNQIGRPQGPDDLAGANFIGYAGSDGLLTELVTRGLPLTQGNFRWSSASLVVGWEMVKQGLGLGVMMTPIAAATPEVEQVLPEMAPFPVPIWLVTHRELHTSRRIRLVFDFLAEAFG